MFKYYNNELSNITGASNVINVAGRNVEEASATGTSENIEANEEQNTSEEEGIENRLTNIEANLHELSEHGEKLFNVIYRTNDIKRMKKTVMLINKKKMLVNSNRSAQKYYSEGYGLLKRLTKIEEKVDAIINKNQLSH